jgi:hypothetical protein
VCAFPNHQLNFKVISSFWRGLSGDYLEVLERAIWRLFRGFGEGYLEVI